MIINDTSSQHNFLVQLRNYSNISFVMEAGNDGNTNGEGPIHHGYDTKSASSISDWHVNLGNVAMGT